MSVESLQRIKCFQCSLGAKLIDGLCIQSQLIQIVIGYITPNYLNSIKECKLCPIKYCKYCFEYNKNDLEKCTLYADFDIFEKDEYTRIGCALCEENFIFDFIIGECIYQQPSLPNYLRSFINLQNQEICTLPSTDFSVALEIINCGKLIENCLQCFFTPYYQVKCIICNVGFTTSTKYGNCYKNSFVNAKIVIEGLDSDDALIQRAQSFMITFLPNQYFTQRAYYDIFPIIQQYQIECNEGYFLLNSIKCVKYCTSECLNCQEEVNQIQYQCAQCPFNYCYQPIRSSKIGSCIKCPELCEVSEERSEAEIQQLNPYFQIEDDNRMYTYKCFRALSNQNVVIDPYFVIAKFCFTPSCNSEFTNLDDKIDIHYSNQIGLQVLNFQNDLKRINSTTFQQTVLKQETNLKSQIFSLQFLKTKYNLSYSTINQGVISGFDSIEINDAFINIKNQYFQFKNSDQKVNFILKNIMIEQNQINNINYIFDSELFGDITLHNILIINSNFTTSSLFNFNQKLQQGTIKIQKMSFQNCNIFNSQLFQFFNNQVQIQIEELLINQTLITNSSFITFFTNVDGRSKLEIKKMTIISSKFLKSFILNCTNLQDININNFILDKNTIILSTIIAFNKNFNLYETQTNNNTFIESFFIATLETQSQKKTQCLVDKFLASQNDFTTSSLFQISIENLQFQLRNVRIQFNQGQTILEILNN